MGSTQTGGGDAGHLFGDDTRESFRDSSSEWTPESASQSASSSSSSSDNDSPGNPVANRGGSFLHDATDEDCGDDGDDAENTKYAMYESKVAERVYRRHLKITGQSERSLTNEQPSDGQWRKGDTGRNQVESDQYHTVFAAGGVDRAADNGRLAVLGSR